LGSSPGGRAPEPRRPTSACSGHHGASGRRGRDTPQAPAWKDNLLFYEYFHGDNGAGLGAMHQTGWTALVADLLLDPPRRTQRLVFHDANADIPE
jgi:hypothetical protein